jgi:purine-binding chemotaxis protein CheW
VSSERFQARLERFFYRPDEEPGVLELLSPTLEGAPAPAAIEEPVEHLAFGLDTETYAIPIQRVREIVKVPLLTEVPRRSGGLLGIMNLRGEVLPVYDVKPRLGLADAVRSADGPSQVPRSARVVVVFSAEGDAGVLVDVVHDVVKIIPSSIEATPPGVAERGAITGIGRRGETLLLLLELDEVLQ